MADGKFTRQEKIEALMSDKNRHKENMLGLNFDAILGEFEKYIKSLSTISDKQFEKLFESVAKKQENAVQRMSLAQKNAFYKSQLEQIESNKDIYSQDEALFNTYLQKKQELFAKYVDTNKQSYEYLTELEKKNNSEILSLTRKTLSEKERLQKEQEKLQGRKGELSGLRMSAMEEGNSEALSDINKQLMEIGKREEEVEATLKNIEKSEDRAKARENDEKEFRKTLLGTLSSIKNSVQSSLDSLYADQVKFNARTSSHNDAYGNMLSQISDLIGASPFVKQSDVLKNLNEIANTGSNYNIEQRAYLASLASDIASTFNVTGEELLRLNRLLRTDLTASRMGMVQNLTEALNNTFNDSSFMNSMRASVAQGVMDATSQLSSGNGTDFEWAVQTWMGALSSAGVSNDVISMLTQGLNYLGSGNVSAMSGNEQLQTLFALSASNAGGKSYSEMLVDGIDASDVNRLMSEMITYLKEISDENKVVQSEYFRILGMGGLSNMTALGNIDVNEVMNIASNTRTNINTDYYKTSSLLNRYNILKDNLTTTLAKDIGESGARLGVWMTASILEDLVGGLKIPSFLTVGTGLTDLPTIAEIMKSGVVLSDAYNIGSALGTAMRNRGIADFGAFTEQAGGIGTGFGTSLSYAVGSASSSDVMKSSITSQAKQAKENKKTVSSAIGETEEESSENQLKSIKKQLDGLYKNTQIVKDDSVIARLDKMFEKFEDDSSPIKVEDKSMNAIKDVLASPDRVQKVEGTVTLAGFGENSEQTLNNVLTNAIALALKMILGGATTQGAGSMSISSGNGWDGYMGNEYMGSMTLMEFLNRIISSNEQTMAQISDTFGYFAQQQDSSYIR